jgi:hypothetical protein
MFNISISFKFDYAKEKYGVEYIKLTENEGAGFWVLAAGTK